VGLLVATWAGCSADTDEPEAVAATTPVDAGDAAFVQRVIPIMWGRRATSSQEVAAFTDAVEQRGRESLVRAMARSPEYLDWWELQTRDLLLVSRLGFAANPPCYGRRSGERDEPIADTDELARFVRDNPPEGSVFQPAEFDPHFSGEFTMRDLIRSSLVLDDLGPVFQAHLIAHLTRALDDMRLLAAMSQRRNRVETFEIAYLGRRMPCLTCHNGEFAVTDNLDPALDRHWPPDGHFEKAIYGASTGLESIDDLTGFFRRKGVLGGYVYTHDDPNEKSRINALETTRPWGWDTSCGNFVLQAATLEDDSLSSDGVTPQSSFFGFDRSQSASIWDLEAQLRTGLNELGSDGPLTSPRAFATLTALNLADRLWAAGLGQRLTVATGFARNPYQQEILKVVSEPLMAGRLSLIDTLVAVTGHPYFNGAMPADSADYRAVFDPFVADHLPSEERRNSIGHTLRRMPARMLLRAASAALDWPKPPEYLLYYMSPDARLQRDTGVFLKPGDPGFSGISFQSALAWENHLGLCQDLAAAPVCPLVPILENEQAVLATGCEICRSRNAACDWDARCCDVDWTLYCDDTCSTGDPKTIDFTTWPTLDQPSGPDWLAQLISGGAISSYREAVTLLKDRLLAEPIIEEDEVAALEALLERSLDDPLDSDAETRVRRVCGALLQTPQFTFLGGPGAALADIPVGDNATECGKIAGLFTPALDCTP
jgi:hypothetical protein